MILRAIEHFLPWDQVRDHLDEILVAMNRFDCQGALDILRSVVAEYRPTPESHDLVWARQTAIASEARKVTNLNPKARRFARSSGPSESARP